ncbi:MAG: hypothetical protein WEE64_15870 [Dehalococcoidia bacterium]
MIALVRLVHGLISLFFVSCLAFIYYAAATRKRGRLVAAAVAALVAEGAIVSANGGDCPLGTVHRRFGDEKTFFELFLPKRLADGAVPFLGGVAVLGVLLTALRPPKPSARGAPG